MKAQWDHLSWKNVASQCVSALLLSVITGRESTEVLSVITGRESVFIGAQKENELEANVTFTLDFQTILHLLCAMLSP